MVLITTLTYLPDSQLVHTVEEKEDEYLPSSQSAHVEAPTALENLPAAQSLQTEAPAAAYLPAPQLVLSPSEMQKSSVAITSEARPSRKAMSQAFEHVEAWRR